MILPGVPKGATIAIGFPQPHMFHAEWLVTLRYNDKEYSAAFKLSRAAMLNGFDCEKIIEERYQRAIADVFRWAKIEPNWADGVRIS